MTCTRRELWAPMVERIRAGWTTRRRLELEPETKPGDEKMENTCVYSEPLLDPFLGSLYGSLSPHSGVGYLIIWLSPISSSRNLVHHTTRHACPAYIYSDCILP